MRQRSDSGGLRRGRKEPGFGASLLLHWGQEPLHPLSLSPTTQSALEVSGCLPGIPTFCYDRAFLGLNRLEDALWAGGGCLSALSAYGKCHQRSKE